jgi:hypothetical protein
MGRGKARGEQRMRADGQTTGMLGVYLVAAELSRLGFIVSPTSRSARGADLLVTDQFCNKAWSVQVKAKRTAAKYWLVGKHASFLKSSSHLYVFVSLKGNDRPEYLVVPSVHVAKEMTTYKAKTKSEWYAFEKPKRSSNGEGWEAFGHLLTTRV